MRQPQLCALNHRVDALNPTTVILTSDFAYIGLKKSVIYFIGLWWYLKKILIILIIRIIMIIIILMIIIIIIITTKVTATIIKIVKELIHHKKQLKGNEYN